MKSTQLLACFAVLLLRLLSTVDARTCVLTGGARWSDPNNWRFNLVPRPSDEVRISSSRSFDVIVDRNTTIKSLKILSDSIRLVVDTNVTFSVTSQFRSVGSTLRVRGTLNVSVFVWSGEVIEGSQTSSSVRGRIVVNNLSVVKRGFYAEKRLRNVIWTNRQRFTFAPSMNRSVVFCRACLVVNEASSTMMLRGAKLESDGDQDLGGFSSGIVNRGLVFFELISNYSICWNVANIGGRIQIFGVERSQHRLTMTLYRRWVNDGAIRLYAVSLRFSHANVATRLENGTWEVYSYPATSEEYALGSWKNLLAQYDGDARRNRSRYDVDIFIDQSMTFFNVTAFGCVRMHVGNRPSTVRFVSDLNLGDCGELLLRRKGRVNERSVFAVSDVAQFRVDFIVVSSGWTLNLSTRGKVAIRRRLVVETNAAATMGSDVFASDVTVGSVYLSNDARFDVFNRNVTIDDVFRTNGTVNLTEATLRTKEWHYERGYLIGSRASLHVLARGCVASRVPITVDGVALKIEASPIPSSRRGGVLAEYFQYRVDTDLTSRINSLSHFPGDGESNSLPRDFDDGSYRPSAVQFLSSFDHLPRRSGSSPLALKPDYVRTDVKSPHSFTFNYAVRLWSFLVVDETGFYRFRFLTGAGLRVRLWIDDRIVFTSRKSLRYLYKSKPHITESFDLRQGISRLRIDFIQERLNSSDYDNALLVDYAGPSFDWRPIPTGKLFQRYALPDGTSQHANPKFDVERFDPTTSYFRGNSLIVAKNGADLTVSETGVVEVGHEFRWISHSTGLQSNVVNRGRIVDVETNEEVALSSIFVNYYDDYSVSNGNSTSVTWINSNGGLWDDETNWYPRRVPRGDDDVYISMEGVYQIIIGNYSRANALSLTVGNGSSDSRPELVVGAFASADFGRLDVNTPITTIRGRLSVNFLTFRGQTITGGGEIDVATRFFFARSSSYKNRYFSRINVTVSKLFDVESKLYSETQHLYCDRCSVINEVGSTFRSVDLHLFVVSSESEGFRQGLVNYGLVVLELVSATIMAWDVRNYGEFVVVTKTYYESRSLYYRGSFVNYNATRIYLSSVVFRETSTVSSARGSVWKAYGYPMRREGAPSFSESEQVSGQWRRFIDDVYQNVANFSDSNVVWNATFAIQVDVKYVMSSSTFSFFRFETYGYVNFHLSNSVEFADGLYMDRHGMLSLIRRKSIDLRCVAAIGNLVTGQAFVRKGWNLTIGNATFYRRSTVEDEAVVTATNGQESTLDFYDELVVNERAVLNVVDATTNCHSDIVQAGATIRIGNGRVSVDGRFTFEAGELAAENGTIRLRGGFDIVGQADKVFTTARIRIESPRRHSPTNEGVRSTLQTGFSSSFSTFTLAGDGVIVGRQSVTVEVCETCQFHVLDPVRWLPDPSLGVVTTFINSGLLVRRGRPGTAIIYGQYVGSEEIIQTTAKSLVLFRSLPQEKAVTWTNREGGSWNDSSNWNPRRVPLSTDVVRIALPGIYRVTIPDGLVVKVTVLYAESADVELVVESSAQLIVSEIDARLGILTVKGFLQSTWFRWSGRQLDGDLASSATSPSRLVVTTSFIIRRGSDGFKRFRHLVVENRGNLTYDGFFDTLECVHCTIYNYGVYSVKAVDHLSPFEAPPTNGFRSGLINYGFVNIDVVGRLSWWWDVRNYGNISVLGRKEKCYDDFHFMSIVLSNYKQISFYGIGVIVHGSTRFIKGNGSIDFFGSPFRFRGDRESDFESNSTVWDLSKRCYLQIWTILDDVFHFNRIVFKGSWDIFIGSPRRGNSNPNRFFIHSLLEMHPSSTLLLAFSYLHKLTTNWKFIIAPKARVNLGHLRIGRTWSVNVGTGASFDVQGELSIQRHAQLILSSGPNSVFGDVFTLHRTGKFFLSDRLVTMNSEWTLDGHVYLTNSTTVVKGKLNWNRGLVKGRQSATVRLLSGCDIAGSLPKTLDGIAVEISADRQSVRHGIIAEYFQLDVHKTKPLYDLHFPGTESVGPYIKTLPPEFDLPSTKGEMMRFKPSFDSEPEMNKPVWSPGWSPFVLGLAPSEGTKPFFVSCAARLSAYLLIDRSGFYTFFFSMGRGLKIRLLLDGTFYYKSNVSPSFLDEVKTSAIHIKAGLRLMRVDYISQDEELRKTRFSYLSVKYAGPDVPKQRIPSAKLYAVRYNEENGVYEGSASSMKLLI